MNVSEQSESPLTHLAVKPCGVPKFNFPSIQ